VSDYERPVVTTETTDDQLEAIGQAMWACLDGEPELTAAAVVCIGRAYRTLLRCGSTPAGAVKSIGAMALFMSGEAFDMIDGPRAKLRR
jgi:hypothetical protein